METIPEKRGFMQAQVRNGGIVLETFEDMWAYAKLISQSELLPKQFRGKPADVVIAIQMGQEIGLSPLHSVRNIYVVNGRASMWGDAVIALVRNSPVCEWISEYMEDDGTAVCESKRVNDPRPLVTRFTKQDAITAGLWGSAGPWKNYPRRMLQMRARGFNLRDNFADVLGGLITREEAEDYPEEQTAPAAPTLLDRLAAKAEEVVDVDVFEDDYDEEAEDIPEPPTGVDLFAP